VRFDIPALTNTLKIFLLIFFSTKQTTVHLFSINKCNIS